MSTTEKLRHDWRFTVLCAVMIAAGAVAIWKCPADWPQHELIDAVADALIIAGLLALTVDRYIKWRLLHEVSQDVSKFLIGYELPKEIQDRVHDIMATAVIRRDLQQRYHLTRLPDGTVKANVEATFDVENYSSTSRAYTTHLSFDVDEHAEIHELCCHTTDSSSAFSLTGKVLESRVVRTGDSIRAEGKEIMVQPRTAGIRYSICQKYAVIPINRFDRTAIGRATIGVTVMVVERPDDLDVRMDAMTKATLQSEHRWEYRQLFMPGEHYTIKWQDRSPEIQTTA